ncbi:MAG: hypothetical protein RL033_4337 [Pseudomonadota bacterium]|jgi:hypothetical protein
MTQHERFDLDQLEQYLDVYGSALERWPQELQPAARQLLESSPEARQAWSRAERLTALLAAAPDLLPSAELSARIAALPVRRPQGWAAWWPFGNPLAPLFAWAAAAAIGVFVGSGSLPGFEPEVSDEAVATATVSAEAQEEDAADVTGSDDWSEVELALGLYPEWEEEP